MRSLYFNSMVIGLLTFTRVLLPFDFYQSVTLNSSNESAIEVISTEEEKSEMQAFNPVPNLFFTMIQMRTERD